jgi:hypothetical protein
MFLFSDEMVGGPSRKNLGHRTCWNQVRIFEIEGSSKYMKDKELANKASLTKPISQPSFEIYLILI